MRRIDRKDIKAILERIKIMIDEYAFDYNIKTMTEKSVGKFVDKIDNQLAHIRLYSKPRKRIKKKCKI